MKNKIFSILLAVFFASLITGVGWAAPFEVPPKGGLPQCKADLEGCETDLDSCGSDLAGCATQLGICTSDLGVCNGDLSTCSDDLGICTSDLVVCSSELDTCGSELITCTQNLDQASHDLSICETGLVVCQENAVTLPATGQTTCYDVDGSMIACDDEPWQDGYFKAGGSLAYIWNNDGTLIDVNTKLMWERKDMSGGIHDVRNKYDWLHSFLQHIFSLNNTCQNDETVDCSVNGDADCVNAGVGGVCGFAGYRDWRVPNAKEMQSIVDYSQNFPPVSMAFNYMCSDGCSMLGETGCSCTEGYWFWTSTTYSGSPDYAWHLTNSGSIRNGVLIPQFTKGDDLSVRAVRGGL